MAHNWVTVQLIDDSQAYHFPNVRIILVQTNPTTVIGRREEFRSSASDISFISFVCRGVTVTKSACGITVDCGADVVRTYVLTGNENEG
jgi:hypothetical protein